MTTDDGKQPPGWDWGTLPAKVLVVFYVVFLCCLLAFIFDVPRLGLLAADEHNRFRKFFEILSFISTALIVPGVALWAVSFARAQAEEARKQAIEARNQAAEAERSRLATVYLEITKRWVEDDLVQSRRFFQLAKKTFEAAPDKDPFGAPLAGPVPTTPGDYVQKCLMSLRERDLALFGPQVRILTFFEDLGELCRQNYVEQQVILDFIGGTVVEVVELALPYIKYVRRRKTSADKPDEPVYANLIWLYRQAHQHGKGPIYKEADTDLPLLKKTDIATEETANTRNRTSAGDQTSSRS